MHPTVVQRVIVKFLVNENVNTAEIRRRLLPFGERTLSWAVKQWCNEFKKGRERVKNMAYPHCPCTSITTQNIEAVRKFIEGNRHFTVFEISHKLQISCENVQSIIRNELGFQKMSACWISKLLNED